jgi:glyoxylase-like metal-dependent hydrolase (beta-lactamase superfamily II)
MVAAYNRVMELAPGIRRIGDGIANVYLVEEAGAVTIIDAGMPGHWRELPGELAAMGRSLEDVRAVVLTHGHSDHVGFAERIRSERGVPIEIHEADAALARGEVPNPSRGWGKWSIGPTLSFLWYGLRRGGLRAIPIKEVITFGDGATLDVPGAPRVIHVPGHTPGCAALQITGRSALFVGDALATYSVLSGARGPRIAPFSADPEQALTSLSRLGGLDASLVLPGHGEPWTEGIDLAIAAVRRSFVPA